MSNVKHGIAHRLLAAFLALVMVFGLVPVTTLSVNAATAEHPDAVTITVTGSDGKAIQGASVTYTIDSVANGDAYITKTETTDEYGVIEVLAKANYVADDFSVSATVTKTGYETGSLAKSAISSETQDFSVVLTAVQPEINTIEDVAITPAEWTYDGIAHELVTVTAQEGDVVTYQLEDAEPTSTVPTATDVGNYSVTVTVQRAEYEDLVKTVSAVVSPAAIPVDITAVDLTYNGENQNLVAFTGELLESDAVTWEVDGVALESRDIPTAKDAGTYAVKLTVVRNTNYITFTKTISVTIAQADIPGVEMSGKGVLYYDGTEQALATLTGVEDSDTIIWTVNGNSTESEDIPSAMALGTYTVAVSVDRGANYKSYENTVTVVIDKGILNLDGLTVKGLESVYTGLEQDAVEVTPDSGYDYTLMYQLDDGDLTVDEDAWANTIPTVTDAGSYVVWVKAVKENYSESNVTVTPAPSAVTPYNVYIAKAQQTIEFVESNPTEDTISGEKSYNFAATDVHGYVGEVIVYSLGEGTDEGIASIDVATGKLTVTDAGTVVVVATLPGNGNYETATLTHTMNISEEASDDHKLVYFATDSVSYTFGENNGVVSTNSATKRYNNDNNPTYSINKTDIGLSIDKNSGKVTITDYAKLGESLIEGNGTVTVTVTADKAAKRGGWGGTRYAADSDTYTLIISFLETPTETVSVAGTKGLIGETETGWYVSAITVSPVDGTAYTIADSCVPSEFGASVVFDNQGTDARYVHLMSSDGGITNRIAVNEKVDTQKPDATNMSLTFSDLTTIQKIGKLFGFYNPSVTVTFTVGDETGTNESGINHIDWIYTKDVDATSSILASKGGELPVELVDGKYVATLTLTASEAEQLRGNVSFTATDNAGNVSDEKQNDVVVVVDTINPTMKAAHTVANAENGYVATEDVPSGKQYFYNGDVNFTFTIKEANFFSDDVNIAVTKNGVAHQVSVTWTSDAENDEVHYGNFTLSGDGDYVVTLTYTDNSRNTMMNENGVVVAEYVSDVITIDETAPVVDFEFVREEVDGVDVQKIIFKVTEHNFRASDITVTGTMLDITGEAISITPEALTTELQSATWKQDGDVWTYEKTDLVNGIFDLDIDYTDISNNSAVRVSPDTYIIDHGVPTDVKIEIITDPIEEVISVLTLGFYNPDVTVRFTAYDDTAGVESFTWNYTKQSGASDVNRDTDTAPSTIAAGQDSENKSLYTATITLPNTDAKQLRGYLAVYATDAYGNKSVTVTEDAEIIVVDTIAPEVSVAYSEASRMVDDKAYYNGDVAVTITVTEANFFADDVVVKVSKNGAEATAVTPTWADNSVDEHIGTFTLTGDGHYIITVEYEDKSDNYDEEKSTYTSHEITIDTVKPEIEVEYQNSDLVNTLKDGEGNNREYFAKTQTAVITITEHNFDADEVEFTIIAKDVAGNELPAAELHSKAEWTVDNTGDVHKITITYPGDANYTFDVAYTDLATNPADEYTPDYFTVDTTVPEYVSVEYSTSKLETVLDTISFGFYDAKMTVTLTARDDISGVHSFMYSYLIANGVSSVNAESVNQIIEAADITYSDNGATATVKFEIPKAALGNGNQFNGTVEFYATDRAGNTPANAHKETKRIVVDNIAPTAQVAYNPATNTEGTISYYDGPINATVTITEANFYANDVQVMVSKNGGAATAVTPAWTNNSVDVHTGTFTLTEDGDYIITINYADKSTNQMATYTSNQLTIDTEIEDPVITINGEDGNGKAYKDDVVPSISFEDVNFDNYEVTLTRTSFGSKNVDVTDKFIGDSIEMNENGGTGTFDTFEKISANDGIYTLTVKMTDKAGHSSETSITFTVNRFGSVYEYSDYLVSLISDGGAYVTSIVDDLVISEYNADRLVNGSLVIEITCDGKPLGNVLYTVTPDINNTVAVGDSGWYQYTYVISKDNFTSDGVYKISVSSKDATGNNPENNNYEDMGITFRVDSTLAEITSIVGLEEAIINATDVAVKYTVYDTMGIKSIKIYVDGELVDEITDFSADLNNYSGSFILTEQSAAQSVRIVVEDMSGNITDTDAEDFSSAYEFNKSVTVSTNIFVRWYANKPLFWGSIGGVVVVAGGLWFFLIAKRKKKEDEEATAK